MRTREIIVDICPSGITSELSLHQGESGIPYAIDVYDDGIKLDLDDWEKAELVITTPSGSTGLIDCEIDEDVVKCAVTQELTAEAGTAIAELRLSSEDSVVISNPITVTVIGSPSQTAQETSKALDERAVRLEKALADADGTKAEYEKATRALETAVADYEQRENKAATENLKEAEKKLSYAIDLANKASEAVKAVETDYGNAEEALNKAKELYDKTTAEAIAIYRAAEEQCTTAMEALNLATEEGVQAIARKSLDESSNNRRGLADALKRLVALEAVVEALVKKGGEGD